MPTQLLGMCTNKQERFIPGINKMMYVKCGTCPACLQEKALKRSNRIRYQDKAINGLFSWFVTLTYDNKFIPYIRPSEVILYASGEIDAIPLHRDFEVRWVTKMVDVMVPGKRKALVKSGKKVRKSWTVERSIIVPLELYKKKDFNYYGYDFDFDMYRNFDFPLLQRSVGFGQSDCIPDKSGVLYYKDFQNFIKRLREILIRDFGKDISSENFKYSICTEYGPETHRPHAHFLIWTPKMSTDEFTSAILKAWPYADPDRQREGVERNYDASSYISSYVNSHAKYETFFRYAKPFKQKQKFSQVFGLDVDVFSASSVRKKFFENDMHIYVERIKKGQSTTESIIFPKYVVNHFFPKFKGFGRLTHNEIQDIVMRPDRLATKYYAERLGFFKNYDKVDSLLKSFRFKDVHCKVVGDGLVIQPYEYTTDLTQVRRRNNGERELTYSTEVKCSYSDCGKKVTSYHPLIDWKAVFATIRLIKKKKKLYIQSVEENVLPGSARWYQLESEFAFIYSQIWALRSSCLTVDNHLSLSDNRHYVYQYDNVSTFFDGAIYNDLIAYAIELLDAEEIACLPRSPNDFPDNIAKTNNMAYWYDVYCKDRKIRNIAQPRYYYKRKIS